PPPPPPPPPPPSAGPYESNDSTVTAAPLSIIGGTSIVTATIGDGAYGAADVDFFAVTLAAGSTFTVDVDAQSLTTPSTLDSFVRVFNAAGVQLAANDDSAGSLDSYVSLTVSSSGTYYIGVSAYGNSQYSPAVAGSGIAGTTTGEFRLRLTATAPPAPTVTADILDVSPDPRSTAVEGVIVTFSLAVTGFDSSDLVLTRDRTPVTLSGVTVTSTDGMRWTVAGLAEATTTVGAYVLTLNAATSGIVSRDGASLVNNVSDSWTTTAAQLTDAGDTLSTAAAISAGSGSVRLSGRVGDGSHGSRDVDLYGFTLAAGQRITVDVDARSLAGSSTLDSYLRVFDSAGRQVAFNDDANGSLDSFLTFTARSAGTYYVGVSGYGNAIYSATRAGSGRPGSTGVYQVQFDLAAAPGSNTGTRAMGFRDSSTSTSACASAFAMYGANWQGALPSAVGMDVTGPRRPTGRVR
ncbi:MAG: PPC domain-containing protein, partial [Planctomycetaceae bacterium]